jgi:hypothetical protein
MGAERFDQYQKGTDANVAFDEAVDKAGWEHGHGGYSGTLAEKHQFVMRNDGKPLTKKEAESFADDDLDENDHDKWGPAWAVPIRADDSPEVIGFYFYGYASS